MDRKVIINLAFLAVLGLTAYWLGSQSIKNLEPWYSVVVSKGEVRAALWADANIEPKTLFAADLFNCEMLTAVGRKYCTVGGAWELADSPNLRFSDNEKLFLTTSSTDAWNYAIEYNVSYVFTSDRQGFYAYGWKYPANDKFKSSTRFTLVYDYDGAKIYKVNRQAQ